MVFFSIGTTNTPPKLDLMTGWIRDQPWGPRDHAAVTTIGSFHLDDPEGQVGMQVFILEAESELFQVPLTYRDAPLAGADDAFIATMQHSVLGTRYVYDGVGDPQLITVLAGAAVAGYGQALGFAQEGGRWHAMPDGLLVHGAHTLPGRTAVDRFSIGTSDGRQVTLANDTLEMTIIRCLVDGPAPSIGLTASWKQRPVPIPLVTVRKR